MVAAGPPLDDRRRQRRHVGLDSLGDRRGGQRDQVRRLVCGQSQGARRHGSGDRSLLAQIGVDHRHGAVAQHLLLRGGEGPTWRPGRRSSSPTPHLLDDRRLCHPPTQTPPLRIMTTMALAGGATAANAVDQASPKAKAATARTRTPPRRRTPPTSRTRAGGRREAAGSSRTSSSPGGVTPAPTSGIRIPTAVTDLGGAPPERAEAAARLGTARGLGIEHGSRRGTRPVAEENSTLCSSSTQRRGHCAFTTTTTHHHHHHPPPPTTTTHHHPPTTTHHHHPPPPTLTALEPRRGWCGISSASLGPSSHGRWTARRSRSPTTTYPGLGTAATSPKTRRRTSPPRFSTSTARPSASSSSPRRRRAKTSHG